MSLIERVEKTAREHYAKKVDKLLDELLNSTDWKDIRKVQELKTRIKEYQS